MKAERRGIGAGTIGRRGRGLEGLIRADIVQHGLRLTTGAQPRVWGIGAECVPTA